MFRQRRRAMMRISGPNGVGAAGQANKARRTTGSAFTLDLGSETRPTTANTAPRNIGGIDTLLALQGVEEPGERRRRAVKRGRGALDALDALKIGLLSGTLDATALQRLKAASSGLREQTGEPGLDTVMAEIALRVEVELAKIGLPPSGRQVIA
jgi:hypothetical protein